MRLLVDCVAFQIVEQDTMQLWQSLLPALVKQQDLEIYILDRGNAPLVEAIKYIPFPSYNFKNCAADSMLIQKICDQYNVDAFCSTYYTSPTVTPMLLILREFIPELLGLDMLSRRCLEKDTAICYAQRYICLSAEACSDLLTLYPEIPSAKTVVAFCGGDKCADLLAAQLKLLVTEAKSGEYEQFFVEWRRLRGIQASVDFE